MEKGRKSGLFLPQKSEGQLDLDQLYKLVEAVVKDGRKVDFDPSQHSYRLDGVELLPVSTYLKRVVAEFDPSGAVFVSSFTGKDALLDAWKQKAREAASFGTALHEFAQLVVEGKAHIGYEEATFGHKLAILNLLADLRRENKVAAAAEVRLYGRLHGTDIAGTADLLVVDEESCSLILLDWKTNESLDKLAGIYHLTGKRIRLRDKYLLQVSAYRLLLLQSVERLGLPKPDVKVGIVHITEDGYKLYKPKPLSADHLLPYSKLKRVVE